MSAATRTPAPAAANAATPGSAFAKRRKVRAQRAVKLGALVFLVILFSSVTLLLGRYTVTIPDFFRIIGGADIPGASFIVMENRIPRVLIGAMIGAAFGVAGAIFQTMLRNPLASPDIIGISYGASASAVLAIVLFGASGLPLAGWAMVGALVIALAIYAISKRGGVAGYRLILVGIGFSAVLQSIVSFLLTRADINLASEALVWLNGSLNQSNWERLTVLALALAVLVPVVVVLSRPLRGLELGDDAAAGLGVSVERSRLALVVTGVLLAAVATAAAGPVSFIAFLSGPIARRFLGGHRPLLTAALVGAVIVLGADFVGANLIPGVSLPVGVITGVLGAPFLLWLLATSNRSGQGG
ncbi:FecCD family ABC transporter permease [Arthrobacter sp. JZ12]|uniref:FecCD family ABC transporter permease n=1 Tax=Arthrobacter sp. JZ12 TaxID=2654190 RepID=UPI003A5CCA3B